MLKVIAVRRVEWEPLHAPPNDGHQNVPQRYRHDGERHNRGDRRAKDVGREECEGPQRKPDQETSRVAEVDRCRRKVIRQKSDERSRKGKTGDRDRQVSAGDRQDGDHHSKCDSSRRRESVEPVE